MNKEEVEGLIAWWLESYESLPNKNTVEAKQIAGVLSYLNQKWVTL
jgi:hypothetical protein